MYEEQIFFSGDPLTLKIVDGSLENTEGFQKIDNDVPIAPTVVLLHGLGGSYDTDCNQKIAK
ncbi:unnamed protein product, partial [Nesidiocoris tenuis]